MAGLRRLAWVGILASLFGVLVGAALASRSVAATTPVHKLVPYPTAECLKEKLDDGKPKHKIVGGACVDYRFGIFPERWTTLTSGKAVFDDPGYKNTFTWNVPETIGPGPAPLALSITALDKSGGRSCPGINIRGIGVKSGESADFILPVCADKINNPATSSGSVTLHLTPPGPGPVTLTVGLAPGMQFLYRYVDATTTTPSTTTSPTSPSSCSAPSRELFAVAAPTADKRPALFKGKLGVGLTAVPEDAADRELVEVVRKMRELGGVYAVDTPEAFFDALLEIKANVKPIDYLVIAGHGSGGSEQRRYPLIDLGDKNLRAEDVDLAAIREQLRVLHARPQTKVTKDLVCKLEAKVAYLDSISNSMAKDATVILLNCAPLATPAGRKFIENFGRVLLSKRGGTVIASRTDVQFGVPSVGGTILNLLALGQYTFWKNFISYMKGDIPWEDVKVFFDSPPGEGFVKGQFEAIKIPAQGG